MITTFIGYETCDALMYYKRIDIMPAEILSKSNEEEQRCSSLTKKRRKMLIKNKKKKKERERE